MSCVLRKNILYCDNKDDKWFVDNCYAEYLNHLFCLKCHEEDEIQYSINFKKSLDKPYCVKCKSKRGPNYPHIDIVVEDVYDSILDDSFNEIKETQKRTTDCIYLLVFMIVVGHLSKTNTNWEVFISLGTVLYGVFCVRRLAVSMCSADDAEDCRTIRTKDYRIVYSKINSHVEIVPYSPCSIRFTTKSKQLQKCDSQSVLNIQYYYRVNIPGIFRDNSPK